MQRIEESIANRGVRTKECGSLVPLTHIELPEGTGLLLRVVKNVREWVGNMNGWKSLLKADPTGWLLEKDNPSIRYWALRDLLDKRENEPEVAGVREKISETEEVQTLFSKIDINGGPFWSRSNGDIYWGTFSTGSVLWFLAETGLRKEDPRIEGLAKFLLGYQSAEGFFKPGW